MRIVSLANIGPEQPSGEEQTGRRGDVYPESRTSIAASRTAIQQKGETEQSQSQRQKCSLVLAVGGEVVFAEERLTGERQNPVEADHNAGNGVIEEQGQGKTCARREEEHDRCTQILYQVDLCAEQSASVE